MHNSVVAVINVLSDKLTGMIVEKRMDKPVILHTASRQYSGFYDGAFLDERELHEELETLISDLKKNYANGSLKKILLGIPGEFTVAVLRDAKVSFGQPKRITNADIDKLLRQDSQVQKTNGYSAINASPVYFTTDDKAKTISALNEVTSVLKCKMSYVLAEKQFTDLLDIIAAENGVQFVYSSSILAEIMYVLTENQRDNDGLGAVFCDIGYISSTVAITCGDGILYQISFPEGEGSVAAELSTTAELPFDHALQLTRRLNFNLECADDDVFYVSGEGKLFSYKAVEVLSAAIPALFRIAKMIEESLDRAGGMLQNSSVPIYITGSKLLKAEGVLGILENELSKTLSLVESSHPEFMSPELSSLAGMAEVAIRSRIKE